MVRLFAVWMVKVTFAKGVLSRFPWPTIRSTFENKHIQTSNDICQSYLYRWSCVKQSCYLHQKWLQDIVSNNTQQDNTLWNYIKLIQIIFNTKMLICMEFMFILANTWCNTFCSSTRSVTRWWRRRGRSMDQWLRKVLMRGVGPGQPLLWWKVIAGVVGVNHGWSILRICRDTTWWKWKREINISLRWMSEQVQPTRIVLSCWNTSWYLSPSDSSGYISLISTPCLK